MSVYRPRTRILSFRISEDEYKFLRQSSLNEGARSVSDYARAIVCRIAAGEGDGARAAENKFAELDQKIEELDREVQRLQGMLERSQDDRNPGDGSGRGAASVAAGEG